MKPHNHIDDYFKDNLSHSEIPMSGVEELWDKIDPNKPRRRFPFLIWFSLGLIGLVFIGWAILNLDNPISNFTESSQLNTSTTAVTEMQEKDTPMLSATTVQQESEDLIENITAAADSKSIVKNKIKSVTNNNYYTSNSNVKQIDNGSTASTSSAIRINPNHNDIYSQSNIPSVLPVQKDGNHSILENNRTPLALVGMLSIKTNYDLNYSRDLPNLDGLLISNFDKRIKPVRPFRLWYGQLSTTTSLVSDRIGIEGMDTNPTSEEWKRSIDPLASFQVALAIGRQISSKSSVNIGLEYQYVDSQHTQDTIFIGSETLYNPEAYITSNGFRGDSVLVTTITKGVIMRSYRETLINIPLRYNYNVVRKGHFGLDASLGLVLNLSRQQSGPVLNSDNEWINVSGQSQNRIGFSYDLSLSAMYALKNQQSLFLSPRFRHSPSDHLEDLPFNLSRIYFGMELGYRMAF